MIKLIWVLIFIITLAGCEREISGTRITDSAVNLGELNSIYDDYNSDIGHPVQSTEIYFSSNRKSAGDNFDIVTGIINFAYYEEEKVLTFDIPDHVLVSHKSSMILGKVNNSNDQFGPFTYYVGAYYEGEDNLLFMYATQTDGRFGVNFVELSNYYSENNSVTDSVEVPGINDIGDNLYPSIGVDNKKMYFCSNRNDSVFNIYSAQYSSDISGQVLRDGNIEKIEKESVLSSPYDDKCPYTEWNMMVFTSNRPGGFGGYDLYYSHIKDGKWSTPKNFGEKINSEYDEFRPVIFSFADAGSHIMVFSSNRPEGKGGFDLYIVNIDDFRSQE